MRLRIVGNPRLKEEGGRGVGGGGEGGRGDDKQRPKHSKVINVPMSITETHFLLPC